MSVTLTGTGGLFTRLGRLAYGVKSANLYLGATDISAGGLKAVGVTTTDVLAQFASALQYVPDGINSSRDSARQSLSNWKSDLRAIAAKTVIEQVHADATLVSKDIETALRELIRQMIGSGTAYAADNDVDASTVSASVSAVSTNTGTGACVCSVVRPDGGNNELVFGEVFEVAVTTAAGQGGTARSETCSVKGEVAVSDSLAFDWPGGSGASTSLTVVDATIDGSTNMLYNSDFQSYTTTDTPDYWAILVGAATTDILKESSTVYRSGTNCLRFKGDGVTLPSIAQSFAQTVAVGSGGTSATLKPDTVYAVNCWARKSASAAAGVLNVRLLDSSNAQTTDDASTNNSITVAVGSLSSASWTAFNGFFRTPKAVTSATAYKLNVRTSTAITSGESIYVADLAMAECPTPIYANGPYAAVFAGATNFIQGDKFNVTVSQNRAGEIQEWFDRFFGMRQLGLILPSDTGGSETIVDTLVA